MSMLQLPRCSVLVALVMLPGCMGSLSEPIMPSQAATQQVYSPATPPGYAGTPSYAAPAPARRTSGFLDSLMPHERTDTVRYAELWYSCHDGEREAKIIQCQRIADPTRDENCIVALEAQQRVQNAPRGYAVPMLGVSNGPSAYCRRHMDSPPPPGY